MSEQRIAALVRKINAAKDFGYDDESIELTALLAERGKNWKWSDDFFSPVVVIYDT
ncbi:hypothetical protein FDH86_gp095 [Arthrobacter phage Tank]|uniref:Uncharacterized protein n=1 Tax=Arthrobacter phage Tank TaxID=1772319 RepID=A0A0U4IJE4_9CAUD|nr:hypothetical protein FDH86_gp095 [Arthrobacter phage Tank]ALY10630.1 hypothetical protein TANK_95 [Arthrobacter phage Tank]